MKIKSSQIKLLIVGLISATCAIAGPTWQIRINSSIPVKVTAGKSNCWYSPNTQNFASGGNISVEEDNSGNCWSSSSKSLDLMVNNQKVTLKSDYGWTGVGFSDPNATSLKVYFNDVEAYQPTIASDRDRFGGNTRVDIVVWSDGQVDVKNYIIQ